MTKMQTKPWGRAEHLETEEDMAAYLEAALEEGDPALVDCMGDIARQGNGANRPRNGVSGVRAFIKRCRPKATQSSLPSLRLCGRLVCGCERLLQAPSFCIVRFSPVVDWGLSRGQGFGCG